MEMLVSVLVNNYNYSRFLNQCIDSILSQSYRSIEIIVYDDGSNDDSIETLANYEDSIKVIANQNFGSFPSFNQANAINQSFFASKGEIIFLLDSDDFFHPEKVARVVQEFISNPDVLLVQDSAFLFVDGKVVGNHNSASTAFDYKALYYKHNWTAYYNPTSNLSFRRQYLHDVLPLKMDALWRVWPDVRLSRLVPFFGQVRSIPEPFTYYRRHSSNDSAAMNKRPVNALKNQYAHHVFVNRHLKLMGNKPLAFLISIPFLKYVMKILIPRFALKIKLKK